MIIEIREFEIKRDLNLGSQQADKLNRFVQMVEKELEAKFSNKDKIRLKDNADTFIIEYLRPYFEFAKAKDDFNLQILGVDSHKIVSEYRKHYKEWNKYPYIIGEDGLFKVDEDQIREKHTVYTRNEFQETTLKFAQDLIKLLDRGFREGVISNEQGQLNKIDDAFDMLKIDKRSFVPSSAILYLNKKNNRFD